MRKIILLAALGVAGFVSANNSVVNKSTEKVKFKETYFRECSVKIRFYNATGQYVGTQTFTSDQPDLQSCQAYQNGVKQFVQDLGYTITG